MMSMSSYYPYWSNLLTKPRRQVMAKP